MSSVPAFCEEIEPKIRLPWLVLHLPMEIKKNDKNVNLRPYTGKVNHNVLQKKVVADICNNSLGNLAGIENQGLPASSYSNDKMVFIVGYMVSPIRGATN